MGLLGVVVASIVGLLWHSNAFQVVLSFVGILVFSALVAYDSQRLRLMAVQTPSGQSSLDFTNLFLFLLRFTGNRKDWE